MGAIAEKSDVNRHEQRSDSPHGEQGADHRDKTRLTSAIANESRMPTAPCAKKSGPIVDLYL